MASQELSSGVRAVSCAEANLEAPAATSACQHTPWTYRPHEFDDWGTVKDARGWMVARVGLAGFDDDALNAHRRAKTDPVERVARLIAAAPELAASLREMKELFRFALLCTTPEIARDGMAFIRKADALLAKATGQ